MFNFIILQHKALKKKFYFLSKALYVIIIIVVVVKLWNLFGGGVKRT